MCLYFDHEVIGLLIFVVLNFLCSHSMYYSYTIVFKTSALPVFFFVLRCFISSNLNILSLSVDVDDSDWSHWIGLVLCI